MEEMSFVFPVDDMPEGSIMGVVINYDPDHNSTHLGISYNLDQGVNVLHLAFHNCLCYDDNWENFTYWIKPAIHQIHQESLSAYCETIANRIKSGITDIPYGFNYITDTIFDNDGVLHLAEGEHGLTCATFVLAIFKSNNIELIDTATWPIREEDRTWAENFIRLFKHIKGRSNIYNISKEHINDLKGEIGCKRYRPEEVAISSALYQNAPADSKEIIDIGAILLKKMKE